MDFIESKAVETVKEVLVLFAINHWQLFASFQQSFGSDLETTVNIVLDTKAMNRQLSELSASELNEAIDDTNFPQSHAMSRQRNSSVCSTSSNSAVMGLSDSVRSLSNLENELQVDETQTCKDQSNNIENVNDANPRSKPIGFMRREHPTTLLKMNGSVEGKFDVPGTPKTPRTSTTPGRSIFYRKLQTYCEHMLT